MFSRGFSFKYILMILGLFGVALFTKLLEELFEATNMQARLNVFESQLLQTDLIEHLGRREVLHNSTNISPLTDVENTYDRQELQQKLSAKLKEMHEQEEATRLGLNRELPTIFVITPTYQRFLQKAELTRVAQTFKHVKNLHWIVVEDSHQKTNLVKSFLAEAGLTFTHLNVRTPKRMRILRGQPRFKKSRGVEQRNTALDWLRKNINANKTKGVLYFADDDNTYDVRIFEEMRHIEAVGVWPVAFTGAARWSGPVCKRGKVVGFHSNWKPDRPFPIDMGAFAVNIRKLLVEKPSASFDANVKPGFLETSFLEQVTTLQELEAKAENCTKVYVWHTRTEVPIVNIMGERQLIKRGKPSNPNIET